MSMRMKSKLLADSKSRLEQAFLKEADVIRLKNVPCEMHFKATGVFMEHEGEKHQYLPVLHMDGIVTEIRGKFPFNVSSLYFGEKESETHMRQTCFYYPSPEELAHMISIGGYYSKHFEIPQILSENEYDFPALVDLTIVPPHNVLAYEQMTYYGIKSVDEADLDKSNVPIFYTEVVGTGISRENDTLLAYYGIETEPGFPSFSLTAKAADYDPPLLTYIEEPVVEVAKEEEVSESVYLSREEEDDLRFDEQEKDVQEEAALELPPLDAEDYILQQASRNIQRRMNDVRKRKEEVKHLDGASYAKTMREAVKDDLSAENFFNKQDNVQEQAQSLPSEDPFYEPFVQEPVVDESVYYSQKEDVPIYEPEHDDGIVVTDTEEFIEDVPKSEEKLSEPDTRQEYKEVDMDLNPEVNEDVQEKREEEVLTDAVDDKRDDLLDMNGKDVSDASLQSKMADEEAAQRARESAGEQLRKLPSKMEELLDKAEHGEDLDFGEMEDD